MRVFAFFLVPILAAQLAVGDAVSWVDAKRLGTVAYFLHNSSPRIEAYDLGAEAWLPTISLSRVPNAFHVDAEHLFISYDKSVYRYALDGTGETHLGNFSYPITALFTDGNLLIVAANSITILDAQSGAILGDASGNWSAGYYLKTGLSLSPASNALFGCSTGISPADIGILKYNDTGQILTVFDSPHHGAYTIGTRTWPFPDGSKVADSSGNVYDGSSLQHLNSFATPIDDLGFLGGEIPIVLSGSRLIAFSKALLQTGHADLALTPKSIFVRTDDVAAFYPSASAANGMGVLFVSLTELNADVPGAPIDPRGLPFTPDHVFVDKHNILCLYSKAQASIFRWDIAKQDWLQTLALLGSPDYITYSDTKDRIYTAYSSGQVKMIDQGAAVPQEEPFANLPSASLGIVAADDYLVTSDASGAWEAHTTFGPDGTQLSYRDWNYPLHGAVWSAVNRRIYHFRDGSSPNDLHWEAIKADGTLGAQGETPYHGDYAITYPIRVAPDGTIVILGSGSIYDAIAMTLLNNLPTAITDVTWVNGEVYSLQGNTMVRYTRPTYAPGASATLSGTGIRLLTSVDNKLVAVSAGAGGVPQLGVYDEALNIVAPDTLAAPLLRITGFGSSSATLAWNDVAGEQAYVVERKTGADGLWTTLISTAPNVISHVDSTVALHGVYLYRVKATNNAKESPWSNEVQVSLLTPAAVTNVWAVADSETQITLGWDDVQYETGYAVYRSLTGASWNLQANVAANQTQFVDTGLTKGTTYFYKVIAKNALADAAASAVVSATTPILPPATPVFTLAAAVSARRISLQWSDVADEAHYRLERCEPLNGPGAWASVATLGMDTTVFEDSLLAPGTQYQYRITASNAGGDSAPALSPAVATLALQIPATPLLQAASASGGAVALRWQGQYDVDLYRIYRRPEGALSWTLIASVAGEVTDLTDTAVLIGRTYEYAMTAKNAAGVSPQTAAVSILVPLFVTLVQGSFEALDWNTWGSVSGGSLHGAIPGSTGSFLYFGGAPRYLELNALALYDITCISFDLRAGNEYEDGQEWNNSESGEQVEFQYYSDDSQSWLVVEALNTVYPGHVDWTHHEIVLPASFAGKTVWFRFIQPNFSSACDQWGLDNLSISTQWKLPPPTPALVTTGSTAPTSITLLWLPSQGAETYLVERSDAHGANWQELAVVTVPQNFLTDPIAPALARTYQYRVTAVNSAGASSPTPPLSMDRQAPSRPTAPVLISAAPEGLGVALLWGAASFEEHYTIERCINGTDSWQVVGSRSAGCTTFADDRAAPGTCYAYRVRAHNLAGASDYSNAQVATTLALSQDDEDQDGLPDDWEILHFGTTDTLAADDFDADGRSNLQEYLEATDPTAYILPLVAGWNLVSIARAPVDNSVATILGTAGITCPVWVWDDMGMGYRVADSLSPLKGYWVYSTVKKDITIRLDE